MICLYNSLISFKINCCIRYIKTLIHLVKLMLYCFVHRWSHDLASTQWGVHHSSCHLRSQSMLDIDFTRCSFLSGFPLLDSHSLTSAHSDCTLSTTDYCNLLPLYQIISGWPIECRYVGCPRNFDHIISSKARAWLFELVLTHLLCSSVRLIEMINNFCWIVEDTSIW
jgi:hypothetical protein